MTCKVQFQNGTLSSRRQGRDRAEVSQIALEINDIRDQTKFNGTAVFKGTRRSRSRSAPTTRETIATTAADISDAIGAAGTAAARAHGRCERRAADDALFTALANVATIDDAIKNVSPARANFGAVQNRLEHRLNNLATYQENLTASESRIRDVDMAAEMTKFTKLNILQQAGTSMLAQANQAPQGVLSLLR